MKLAIGSDHAGFREKSQLVEWLRTREAGRHRILDVGTHSEESCDYPDFARDVAKAVATKRASKGILLCGTGIGMAIAANKIRGIRAAVVWNPKIAALAAEHNEANIICLPSRYVTLKQAQRIIKSYLNQRFGGGRHARRIRKITQLDRCA